MTGLVVVKLPDAHWGYPRIARAVGSYTDPWGVLAVLRETPWESPFPRVSHYTFDHALRGHASTLMRELGPPPTALARRLPIAHARCRDATGCVNSGPKCVPGPEVPECWTGGGFPPGPAAEVAAYVVRLWKEGVPVVVVDREA